MDQCVHPIDIGGVCNERVCRLRDAQGEAAPCNNHDGSYKKWEIIRLFRVEFPPVSGTLFAASMKTGHFTVLGIADPIHVLWFSARERQLLRLVRTAPADFDRWSSGKPAEEGAF